MANNTFVGFNFPSSSTTSSTDSQVVRELQPVTTWNRDGGYTVTRRWRGPIDSLVAFSNGGSGEADYHGTYFTGATGIVPGGAGRDGAVSTDLVREDGGQLGVFSATWVTSDISTALGNPAAAGRTAASGDLYQESSIWTLDGNDIEKDLFDCPVVKACADALGSGGYGFAGRCKKAIENYRNGLDEVGDPLTDPAGTSFLWISYLDGADVTTLSGQSSILGNANLFIDLGDVAEDALKGAAAFSYSQYVLRNVKTVQYTSSILPHYENVNRIWTTANITTLLAAETTGGGRPIDPPTSIVAYTLPVLGVLGTVLNFSKWLYRTPDVQQLNNGKWQITREWWEGTEIATSCYRVYA